MKRLVSLMVVLAHVGVASIPCVEAATANRTGSGSRATHPLPASPVEEVTHAAGHATREHPVEHAHPQHGGAASHVEADAPHRTGATSRMHVVQLEVRAPCLCGCSQRSSSPGTATPQPPSFAPFAPDPPRLVVAILPVAEAAPGPWPVSPVDVVDHVPIAS